MLPHLINRTQTGYVKERFIGESIRLILDIMEYTKYKDIPGVTVFLDFEKAFDSVEWSYIQKCLAATNFGPHLRQSVNVFYHNISSCVVNNGHASESFLLERGVRQGCPLSGMLFVIAIAQKIRRPKMIKEIEIEYNGSQEIQLSQYADDMTALLSDSESVTQLFKLLGLFERCSGLKINESKSELLWLGSWRHRKDKILNLQISEEPVYALGVHSAYERDAALQRNFWDKLISLKKLLNTWSQRDISVYSKINLVKSLALSKLVFICSVMETPIFFVDEVNKIIFNNYSMSARWILDGK